MTRPRFYILDEDGETPIATDMEDYIVWLKAGDSNKSRKAMASDWLVTSNGVHVHVSTVFLSIDHSFSHGDKPVLWETMIFGGNNDQYQCRYDNAAMAKMQHIALVAYLKETDDGDLDKIFIA